MSCDPENNGKYTKIPNEILENLMQTKMSGGCFKCVLLIARKTYGWNKENDGIPASQFVKHTGIDRRTALRILEALVKAKVVLRTSGKSATRESSIYRINTNTNKWTTSVRLPTSGEKPTRASGKSVPGLVAKNPPSKDMYSKDTKTKEQVRVSSKKITMTEEQFTEFWELYPKKKDRKLSLKKYLTIRPELHDKILSALEAVKQTEDWMKEDGQFIPYPSTWLNRDRWEDELEATVSDPGAKFRVYTK